MPDLEDGRPYSRGTVQFGDFQSGLTDKHHYKDHWQKCRTFKMADLCGLEFVGLENAGPGK